jgi:hypothetical protein
VLIVIIGLIAAIVGSLLIGYSFGLRAGRRTYRIAQDMRIAELETAQSRERSTVPVADRAKVPCLGPATERERIAQAVDENFLEDPGNRDQATLRDYLNISASIDFVMSASDSQFLVDYLNWRLKHPIRPSNSE